MILIGYYIDFIFTFMHEYFSYSELCHKIIFMTTLFYFYYYRINIITANMNK